MGAGKMNGFSKSLLLADCGGLLLTPDREGRKGESRDFNQRASRRRQPGLPRG